MITLEDIHRLIDSHDWSYEMSDDHSAWQRGQREYDAIQRALNDAEGETATKGREYWNKRRKEWWGR